MKKILFVVMLPAFSFLDNQANAQALPANYTKTTIVTGLSYPVDFDWAPDGRYFITLKGGNAAGSCANGKILAYSAAGTLLGTFYDLTDSVNCDFERGLLGITVDPAFATNHYVYAYYVHKYGSANKIRIVRFTEAANVGTNPLIILNIDVNTVSPAPAGNHFGGMMRFRPSQPDKIYFCIGDLAYQQTNATLNYANKLTNPYGKILRINTNGTIPTDNPFYDDGNPATGNDDRIWTYGHRNGFGMCFNPATDSMYYSENGLNTWDEFNIIHKGSNYGWATCEGKYLNSSTTTLCNNAAFIDPLTEWGAPLGGVTGCIFYTGSVMPEFNNHVLVADNDYGRIYDLTLGNAPAYDMVTSNVLFADIVSTTGTAGTGLTTMREGNDECIYAMKGGYTNNGEIYRICPTGMYADELKPQDFFVGNPYPSPSTGKMDINLKMLKDGTVNVSIMDITGKKIATIFSEKRSAGELKIPVDSEKIGLNSGSYLINVIFIGTDGSMFSQTKKATIIK